ncbi:MAG: HDOD domain-containing protein [Tepidisphaerales bacterium]
MKTILVVDDMAVFREPIAVALRARGYDVVCAADGEDALLLMGKQVPDLVLLDIGMPRLDGLALMQRMKADPRWAAIPVIFLTALTTKQYVVQAAKLGVQDYLLKSQFSLRELYERVARRLADDDPAEAAHPVAAPSAPAGPAAAPANTSAPPTVRITSSAACAPPTVRITSSAACAPTVPPSLPQNGQSPSQPTPARPAADSPAPVAPVANDGTRKSAVVPEVSSASPQPRAPYLPAPEAPPPSLEAIKSLQPIMGHDEFKDQLSQCEQIKAFSPIVAQVMKLANNPRCSLDKVVRAINQDNAITLKILKLANSVVYSRGEPVDSVQMAVSRIGMDRIRQAVFNIGIIEQFGPSAFKEQLNFAQFWEHAVAVGVIAAELADALGDDLRPDNAFTMGLLHDVGRVVCIDQLGDRYAQVLQAAFTLELPLEMVESRMMRVNHADIMDGILRAWRFHEHLIVPIASHHLSADHIRRISPAQMREAAILALADRLAHALLLGTSGNHTIYPTDDLCRLVKLDPAVVEHIQTTAPLETTDIKFSMLSSANQSCWTSVEDQYRSALPPGFHPLFASLSPQTDAYRIFCQELDAGPPDQPPTIGVVHLRKADERTPVTGMYLAAESKAKAGRLPLIVISPGGEAALEDSAMTGRLHQLLSSPMVVSRFFRAVQRLAATPVAAAA